MRNLVHKTHFFAIVVLGYITAVEKREKTRLVSEKILLGT